MASNFGLHCKYYAGKTFEWMANNKMIVFLGLLSFSLFVSTLALAGQRNRALAELEDLKTSTVSPPTTEPPTVPSTVPPTETPTAPPTETPAPPAPQDPPVDSNQETQNENEANNKNEANGQVNTIEEPSIKGHGLDEDSSGNSKLLEMLGAYGSAQ